MVHHDPSVVSLAPSSGPQSGGTIVTLRGTRLDYTRSPLCRFGLGTLLMAASFSGESSNGTLRCISPSASTIHSVPLALSWNGGESFEESGLQFGFYADVAVSVLPTGGPAGGATVVTVLGGSKFAPAPALTCRFGHRHTPASYVDLEHIRCRTPSSVANGTVALLFGDESGNGLAVSVSAAVRNHSELARASVSLQGAAQPREGALYLGGRDLVHLEIEDSARNWSSADVAAAEIGGAYDSPNLLTVAAAAARFAWPHAECTLTETDGVHAAATADGGCGLLALCLTTRTHAPTLSFSVEFALLLEGDGARGVAFSYGAPAANVKTGQAQRWDEFGANSGVAVRILGHTKTHWRPYSIEVAHDGVVVRSVPLGPDVLLSGAWTAVQVLVSVDEMMRDAVGDAVGDERDAVVHVSYGGTTRLSVRLEGYSPTDAWRFALSGCVTLEDETCADATSSHSTNATQRIDNLTLTSDAFYVSETVPLHVLPRADIPTPPNDAAAPFSFYAPPRLFALSPTSGPAAFGTVVRFLGAALGVGAEDGARCRFGDAAVVGSRVEGGTEIRCHAPAPLLSGAPLIVQASINGGSDWFGDGLTYVPYPHPRVSALLPPLGPVHGGTLISVEGPELAGGSDYRCAFFAEALTGIEATADPWPPAVSAAHTVVAGSYNRAARTVECVAPPLLAGALHHLSVSLDGHSVSASLPYSTYGDAVVSQVGRE